MRINVEPSNSIFAELGKNTYDFKDLLSELVDNSVAARMPGRLLHVRIVIEVDGDFRPQRFVISDDGAGIPEDKIGPAISPAAVQTRGSLNEHGLGMKQAVAALGQLEFLTTKTANRVKAVQVPKFARGSFEAPDVDFDRECGTTLSVVNLNGSVVTNATSYTRTIVPYLGARYRRFLKPESPLMELVIEVVDVNSKASQYKWEVKEVKQIYFHPGTRENRPVFSNYAVEGNGWNAQLTFGYAPKDAAEYEELGVAVPNSFIRTE